MHSLVGEQGHRRVSIEDCGEGRHDTLSGRGTGPQEGQHSRLRGGDETTHCLVAEQGHGRVSRVKFGEETRRRTY